MEQSEKSLRTLAWWAETTCKAISSSCKTSTVEEKKKVLYDNKECLEQLLAACEKFKKAKAYLITVKNNALLQIKRDTKNLINIKNELSITGYQETALKNAILKNEKEIKNIEQDLYFLKEELNNIELYYETIQKIISNTEELTNRLKNQEKNMEI